MESGHQTEATHENEPVQAVQPEAVKAEEVPEQKEQATLVEDDASNPQQQGEEEPEAVEQKHKAPEQPVELESPPPAADEQPAAVSAEQAVADDLQPAVTTAEPEQSGTAVTTAKPEQSGAEVTPAASASTETEQPVVTELTAETTTTATTEPSTTVEQPIAEAPSTPTEESKAVEEEPPKPDEWEDIVDNGVLRRKRVVRGTGKRAQRGQFATLKYEGKIADTPIVVDRRTIEFLVGEGEVLPVMDMIVQMMDEGETCLASCSDRLAYGPYTTPKRGALLTSDQVDQTVSSPVEVWKASPCNVVMGGVSIEWTFTLVKLGQVRPDLAPDLTLADRIALAGRKKDIGNAFWGLNLPDRALQFYRSGLSLVPGTSLSGGTDPTPPSESTVAEWKKMRAACALNLARAHHKLGNTSDALTVLSALLSEEPHHLTALILAGNILNTHGEAEDADAIWLRAAAIDPEHADVKRGRAVCAQKKKKAMEQERAAFGGMFDKRGDSAAAAAGAGRGGATAASSAAAAKKKKKEEDGSAASAKPAASPKAAASASSVTKKKLSEPSMTTTTATTTTSSAAPWWKWVLGAGAAVAAAGVVGLNLSRRSGSGKH